MDYQQILIIILIINYVGYVGTVWAKFGIQASVSDSFRCWKTKWFNPFTLFMWIITFTLLPTIPNPFFFFAAGGAGFVGAAFNLDSVNVKKVHNKAAITLIVAGLLGIGFTFAAWWTVGIAVGVAALLWLLKIKNLTWWIEHIAFGAIIFELIKNFF
jgi:hypothetical protein